ncbi:MAG: amidase [bacterium]|jgi:Asp-tRNA(Asn)/Glu-tRNA(Gln) amidotransferase A subunit family amidase
MTALYELTLSEASRMLDRQDITSEQLVQDCLERIAEREEHIGAWAHLNTEAALAQAQILDRIPRRSPLHGIPVGVKDLIDTRDFPTEYGCKAYSGHRPRMDAACVALLRRAGAVLVGKTVTTELALFHPGKTANPHNREYSPGGSSSGSAAAVADQMVPFCVGSQTAGSVIRPAAFCGVVGYKPTFGQVPIAGVKMMSATLDTIGFLTRSAADLKLVRQAILGAGPRSEPKGAPRVAIHRTVHWSKAQECAQHALEQVAAVLRDSGATVFDFELPLDEEALTQAQSTIQVYESSRSYLPELTQHPDLLSDRLRGLLEPALEWPYSRWSEAQEVVRQAQALLPQALESCDVVLSLSSAGEAPHGLDTTGDPLFNRIWHVLGVPGVHLPFGKGPNGLPVGVQVLGPYGADAQTLAWAEWIEARLWES